MSVVNAEEVGLETVRSPGFRGPHTVIWAERTKGIRRHCRQYARPLIRREQ